jgi:hypothetical protein
MLIVISKISKLIFSSTPWSTMSLSYSTKECKW